MNQQDGVWPPNSNELPPVEPAAQLSEHERLLAQFIGSKYQGYYEAVFAQITPSKSFAGFNIGAFFFGVMWLFYRKMYLYGFAMLGIILVEGLIETALGIESHAASIGFAVFFGFCGNGIYKHFAERQIKHIQRSQTSPEQLEQSLSLAGGTNIVAPLILLVIVVSLIALSMML